MALACFIVGVLKDLLKEDLFNGAWLAILKETKRVVGQRQSLDVGVQGKQFVATFVVLDRGSFTQALDHFQVKVPAS